MIDLSSISSSIGAYIAPFLPILMNYGTELTKSTFSEIGKNVGESTWEKVKNIWGVIFPEVEKAPMLKQQFQSMASEVSSKKEQAHIGPWIENTIKQILIDNQSLTAQLKGLIEKAQSEENKGYIFNIEKQIAKYITNIHNASYIHIGDKGSKPVNSKMSS